MLAISFPRKLLRQRLENSSAPSRSGSCFWRFWLFSICSWEPRFSPCAESTGADREQRADDAPCRPRKGCQEREMEEGRSACGQESLQRGDSRPLLDVRELIHCARIPAVISGPTRPTAARRRYRSSCAPLFHARSILRPSRRTSPRILVLSATLLIPSPNTKGSIHSLTPWLSITQKTSVSGHCECHRFRGCSRR